MLRKLKWQITGELLAARYNWCQGPVPGRGAAVEKHSVDWPCTQHILKKRATRNIYGVPSVAPKVMPAIPLRTYQWCCCNKRMLCIVAKISKLSSSCSWEARRESHLVYNLVFSGGQAFGFHLLSIIRCYKHCGLEAWSAAIEVTVGITD
jgi:hypothetical protein